MDAPEHKPCPECGAQPVMNPVAPIRSGSFYLGCSNLIDCPRWPVTRELDTPEDAERAWNEGKLI